ncbi:MAG TPA: septum formation initiator family protein [Ktedonobacteraceae bacterium]|nr:septum formation initiator family protein [Ktedonobacteraceae bacterium]
MDEPRSRPSRPVFPSRPEGSSPYVTSAIGLEETEGRLRARKSSLFMRTVVWVTGMICLAFLLGSLVQAWSNSQLMQRLAVTQQQTQQLQAQHDRLAQQAKYYQDPAVIEREARQMGYVRRGEHLVIIVGANDSSQQKSGSSAKTAQPDNFWQEWWNIFFGNS